MAVTLGGYSQYMDMFPRINPQMTALGHLALRKLSVVPDRRTFLSLAFGGILGMGGIFMPVRHLLIHTPPASMPKLVPMPHVARPTVVLSPPAEQRKGVVTIEGVEDNAVEMHQFMKTYTTQFSGMVSCGTQPCSGGTIDIVLDSEHQSGITQEATVQSDGRFTVNVPLQELPDEQVDWKIIARSPQSSTQVIEGRFILTDETTALNVDRSISL